MKNGKLLSLVLVTLLSVKASAQFSIGVNYSPLFPISNYSGKMDNSFAGGTVKLQYHIDDYLALNFGTGYYMIPFKSLNVGGVQTAVSGVSLSVIPATIGAQFKFSTDKLKPYIALDLGYAYTMEGESDYAEATNRGNFIVAPSAGILYSLNENLALHAGLRNNILVYRYRDTEDYNEAFQTIGLELGINYKF